MDGAFSSPGGSDVCRRPSTESVSMNFLDVIWYPLALVAAAPIVIWHAIIGD